MKLGIIGCGAMALALLDGLVAGGAELKALICLVSERSLAASTAKLAEFPWASSVTHEIAAFLEAAPDLVVECASQNAVRAYGAAVLEAGIAFGIASVGVLTDDRLHASLLAAAKTSGARLHIVPGAIGGVDVLAAARLSGVQEVVYTSRKPPSAWKGTHAAALLALDQLHEPQMFFTGTARSAAAGFPRNANAAATVALAGIGLDQTQVQLVADPTITRNVHELRFVSGCVDVSIRVEGRPSPGNPKTSLTAGYSLARFVLNHLKEEAV